MAVLIDVRRNFLLAFLVCVAAATSARAWARQPQSPAASSVTQAPATGVFPRLSVDWHQDHLSLDSAGAPLTKVLAEIALHTGLRVEGVLAGNQTVDAHFAGLPIREALAQILSGVNFAVVDRGPVRAGAGQLTLFILGNSANHAGGRRPSSTDNSNSAIPDEPLGRLYQAAQSGDLERLKQAASARNADATEFVAIDLLAQRAPGAASAMALAAASSSDLGQRVMGLDSLGGIEGPAAVSALAAAMNDPDLGIRQTALAALARQSSPEATRLLQQAAEDRDPSIQQFARSLLAARNAQGVPTQSSP